MLLFMLCCSEVTAKGPEMMPEDDFDSSNKKVKFEDFDTVIKNYRMIIDTNFILYYYIFFNDFIECDANASLWW